MNKGQARSIAKSLVRQTDPIFALQLDIQELNRKLNQLRIPPKGDQGEMGPQGQKGDPGYTPQVGIDFFTDDQLGQIMRRILEAATPRKGVHYVDGVNGERGPMGPMGSKPKAGIDFPLPQDGKDAVVDIEAIVTQVIEELKKERLDISHLKAGKEILAAMGKVSKFSSKDQRWHGGAPTLVAGSNITITSNTDGTKTIASTAISQTTTTDASATTGGLQTIILTHTPVAVLLVVVNGQPLSLAAGDYTVAGKNINLLNPATPASLPIEVLYTY